MKPEWLGTVGVRSGDIVRAEMQMPVLTFITESRRVVAFSRLVHLTFSEELSDRKRSC